MFGDKTLIINWSLTTSIHTVKKSLDEGERDLLTLGELFIGISSYKMTFQLGPHPLNNVKVWKLA